MWCYLEGEKIACSFKKWIGSKVSITKSDMAQRNLQHDAVFSLEM